MVSVSDSLGAIYNISQSLIVATSGSISAQLSLLQNYYTTALSLVQLKDQIRNLNYLVIETSNMGTESCNLNNCNGRGTCESSTGVCVCESGYF
jgi:hypothetical protein